MSYLLQSWRIVLLGLLISVAGCDFPTVSINVEEPPRPANVPASALWTGGPGGGVFVLIRKLDPKNKINYYGEIYAYGGDPIYKGPFMLVPADAPDFDITKKESYDFWDGESLNLSNNRRLLATK